jgi:hypothetical protein
MDFLAGAAAPEMMGAGAPAAPAAGGPDLAALLGPTPGVDDPAEGGSEIDALDAILMACDAYIAIPSVTEQERYVIEQCKSNVQKLKAQNEKMADQISGGTPAARKALGA